MRPISFLLILTAGFSGCGEKPAPPPPAVMPVKAAVIATESVPVPYTLIGRCIPRMSVDIRARIRGTLLERPFAEGELVKKGDLLFRIDPTEFEANLETAKARQAQAEARLALAQTDLKRIKPLAEAGAVPKKDLDDANTRLLTAEADLRYAKATVVNAELELSYVRITAPFDGRVGRASRDPGAVISPADDTLVTIDQVDPIAVEFAIAERDFLALRADIASGRITSPGDDKLQIKIQLLDGSELPDAGHLDFKDVRVDPLTGSAQLRAEFPNAQGLLLPGQFTRVHVEGLSRPKAILVPQKAVLQSPGGSSVYVIAEGGVAEARPVTVDQWVDNRWLVLEGLKEGEKIVVDGLQGVIAGKPVKLAEGP